MNRILFDLRRILLPLTILGCVAGRAAAEAPKFEKPAAVPPVKFVRAEVAAARPPMIEGESYEATVPDTCDLAESARLFVDHYLTEVTANSPELFHEPYNRGNFVQWPPRLTLDIGSYLCGLPKFREALPLLRMMTGSRKGQEIDKAWAEHLLHCIGPDGLYYVPRVGRPWDDNISFGQKGSAYWFPMDKDCEFYTHLSLGNGRLLGALAVYYKLTGDETWNKTAQGIVARMNELAIKDGKVAFFPKFNWVPGEKLSAAEIEKAKASWRAQIRLNQESEEWKKSSGETNLNTALWQTWIITGLAQYYKASGHEPARELAVALTNYLRETKYVEDWKSHFHCVTLGIQAMLEVAQATGDREVAAYAQKAYDEAKSGRKMIALPQIGFFVNAKGHEAMEGCSIGDMTALAVKLTQLGLGDEYWDDIDRYARNCLTGIQRTRASQVAEIFDKYRAKAKPAESPIVYADLADTINERLVGSFASTSLPNDLWGGTYFDTCCQGNCARALYYAWESILKYDKDKGELRVNLLLNRAAPWADVASFLPYAGRVEIKVKQPLKSLKVRMSGWIDLNKVTAQLVDKALPVSWEGRYASLGAVEAGRTVTLEFPIAERTETIESFQHKYTVTFRGADAVDIEPRGEFYTLFQRDHYRFAQPRYLKVKRFVSSSAFEY